MDNVNQSKPQKVQVKAKNEKPFGSKTGHSALGKKNKDGKGTKVTLTPSNGGFGATNPGLKLPHKNRPFNERQANASKQTEISDAASLIELFEELRAQLEMVENRKIKAGNNELKELIKIDEVQRLRTLVEDQKEKIRSYKIVFFNFMDNYMVQKKLSA
ncbi:hypothetical protein GQ457_07G005550 [Hibiscus cannabinus]